MGLMGRMGQNFQSHPPLFFFRQLQPLRCLMLETAFDTCS